MAGQIQVLNGQWFLNIVPEESGLEGTVWDLVEVENLANRFGCVSESTAQDTLTALPKVDSSTLVSPSNIAGSVQTSPDFCVTRESNDHVVPMAVITIGEPDRNPQPQLSVVPQVEDSPDVMKSRKLNHVVIEPEASSQAVSDGVSKMGGNILSPGTQPETSVVKVERDSSGNVTLWSQAGEENWVFMGTYLAQEVDQDTSEDYDSQTENRRASYKSKNSKDIHGLSGNGKLTPGDFMTTEQKLELSRYTEKHGKKESAEVYSEKWNMKVTERCAECCFHKYSTLKEIHGREPTIQEYDFKNIKWPEEDKVIIAKYGIEHGPTEAARHFSKVYKVYLNECNVRSHMSFYRKMVSNNVHNLYTKAGFHIDSI